VDPSFMPVISLGAAAFWIAVAAVLIGGQFHQSRKEALRHATLLRLIELKGPLDEEQMKLLFPPPPPPAPHWRAPPGRGDHDGRVALKIVGTIALAIAAGLAIFFTIVLQLGTFEQQEMVVLGFGWAGLLACLGVGFFVAVNFVRPPPSERTTGETS
jgi:hypothetical protein